MDQILNKTSEGRGAPSWPRVGMARLATGFWAGLAIWMISEAAKTPDMVLKKGVATLWVAPSWAQQHPQTFAALTVLSLFLPLIALAEMGRMRPRRLLVYLSLSAAVLGALTVYSIWRQPVSITGGDPSPNYWPPFGLLFAASFCLFIINQLLEHSERGCKIFSRYDEYFEDSWTRGAQFLLSLCFAGLIILVLNLGGALFELIHLDWFSELIKKSWFWCPAYYVSFAAAVQITDIHPALLRGSRNLCLTLLSWVVPLLTLIAGGFLVALVFTGLAPLWATRHSAALLLSADVVMLVTLNAAYKGGEEQTRPPLAVRWAGVGAAGVLLAFALIAAYAIHLRVEQYGWTQPRVMASALNTILFGYGAGYSWAALRSKLWMQKIEGVNIAASFGVLALAAALFTPIADPARVAVDSQIARLNSARVSPDRFDFQMLRFDAGRYGAEALAKLEKSDRPDVRARAVRAAALSLRGRTDPDGVATAATEAPLSHAVIYPKGALLPKDFPRTGHMKPGLDRDCLTDGSPCEIFLLKGPLANEQVILVYTPPSGKDQFDYATSIWTKDAYGKWIPWSDGVVGGCPAALAALRAGRYVIEPSPQQDLVVGGLRVPLGASGKSACLQPASESGEKRPGSK